MSDMNEKTGKAPRKPAKKAAPKLDAYDELLLETGEAPSAAAPKKKRARDELSDAFDAPIKPKERKKASAKKKESKADEYDLLLEEAARQRAKGPRKPKGPSFVPALLLGLGIAAMGILAAVQTAAYADFMTMRATVERQTFYEGTVVDGTDVSGMTLQDALAHWENDVEPRHESASVVVEELTTVTAGQMGYASDYRQVLESAWYAGRSGALEDRYSQIVQRKDALANYVVHRTYWTQELLDRFVAMAAEKIDQKAVNAGIESFDLTNYTLVFSNGKTGRQLNQDKLRSDMIAALEGGGGTVKLSIQTTEPSVASGDLEGKYGVVAYAVTNASSSSSNRLNNIKLALQAINGTRLQPGETFSFNATVGQRTTAKGYKKAGAYSAGEVTEEVGGGICQVSTTLFNAAVKADLEIVERHNHSLPVGYVDKGKDATVNWDSQDLKFTNTSDDDIYIAAILTSDKRVRIGIFGKQLSDGRYITVEAVTTQTIEFETTFRMNEFLLPGMQNEVQKGHKGYKASAYKIVWSAAGEQLSKTLLCNSNYGAKNAIIEIGPT